MSAIAINAGPLEVQHYPGANLRGHGINSLGNPVYRCVWSESRLHCVGGKWPDGICEYRWIPRYPGGSWVLEKWLSALDFAGPRILYDISMRDEESGLLAIPYPVNGEYEHCYTFPSPCTISMVERVIEWIEAGRKFTPAQLAAAHLEAHNASTEAWLNRASDIWKESQQAFGNAATNIAPSKRTADKVQLDRPSPLPVKGDGKPFV